MNQLKNVLVVEEVAEMLGVTTRAVRNMCKEERLTARKAKGTWLIWKASVETIKENKKWS